MMTAPPPLNFRGYEEEDSPFMAPLALPYQLVGRDKLLSTLKGQLISNQTLALAAINGLPGVGKTAIAVALAYEPEIQEHFSDGILWASLGRQPDLLAILGQWAKALGFTPSEMAQYRTIKERRALLKAVIGKRKILLVVDDVWQSEAALTFQVGGINCAHLVTTRQPGIALDFAGEEVTTLTELSENDGLALLKKLAPAAVASNRDMAKEVLKAVGGLPLAIMLMGRYLQKEVSRGESGGLGRALKQLQDVEERLLLEQPQAQLGYYPSLPSDVPLSLLAAIEISDEALQPTVRRTFYALSVLPAKPNSFSVEAALMIANCSFRALNKLTDYGLMETSGPGRYMLHQAIADYANMNRTDDKPLGRLVTFFSDFVQQHTLAQRSRQKDYELLDEELNNIVAALDVAYKRGIEREFIDTVKALYYYLEVRGLYDLAERLFKRALEATQKGADQDLLTIWLNLGKITKQGGNYTQAERYLEEGLTLAEKLGDNKKMGQLLFALGTVAGKRGAYVQEEAYYQKGLKLARHVQDKYTITALLQNIGVVAMDRGAYNEAEMYYREALTLSRALRNPDCLSRALLNLGIVMMNRGAYQEAESYMREGLEQARALGHRQRISFLLGNLGTIAGKRGAYDKAEAYLQEGLLLARQMRNRERISSLLHSLSVVTLYRGAYQQADEYMQEGLSLARELGYRQMISSFLQNLGTVATKSEMYDEAELYLKEGLALARELGHRWLTSSTLIEWGKLHLVLQNWQLATSALSEALEIAQEVGIQEFIATAQYELARIALWQGERKKAQQQAKASLAIFEQIGHQDAKEVREWLARTSG